MHQLIRARRALYACFRKIHTNKSRMDGPPPSPTRNVTEHRVHAAHVPCSQLGDCRLMELKCIKKLSVKKISVAFSLVAIRIYQSCYYSYIK